MASSQARRRRLYLVRHAIAEERGPAWPDDSKRPLTRRGVRRMRRAIDGLRALGAEPALIVSSPFVRADETARLLAAGLDGEPAVVVEPSLAPGGAPADVARAVDALADASSVALVGHEPDLGVLAGWLLGTRFPPQFRKGGVCCLDVTGAPRAGGATLVWMATPRMLRALG